jgi:hypothetical protein
LHCKPHRSTYFDIRLALRFLRALHLTIFEQPAKRDVSPGMAGVVSGHPRGTL